MDENIPYAWRCDPPETIVAGSGPYAAALAAILGTVALPLARLHAGPVPDATGGYPLALDGTKRVFLVVSEDMAPAESLRCHHSLWNWTEKLSSGGDQHDLAFIFVLPATTGKEYEDALAVGLCVPSIDPSTTGHGVWQQSNTLTALLDLVASVRPMDALSLVARRRCDKKRLALAQLRCALDQADAAALRVAAQAVQVAFYQEEYHLDLFCNAPSHPNGNLLRSWLNEGVTSPVTQDWWAVARKDISMWLAGEPKALAV